LAYIGAHVIIESCRVGYLLLIPRNTTHEKTVMWSLAQGLEFTFGIEITRALSVYFLPLGAFSTCGISIQICYIELAMVWLSSFYFFAKE
jgi:hypothetical protein